MTAQRGMLSYWNGSAWANVVVGSTTGSALIGSSVSDILGTPSTGIFRIANTSVNPYAGSGSAKGPYTGIFTDFMPIRLVDEESKMVTFYGVVYSVNEKYDPQYGMILEVTAKDFMVELRDNVSDGEFGFNIDVSVAVGTYNTNWAESNKDLEAKRWKTGISTKGAVIKSLISKTTSNLTVAGDANRFVDSVRPYNEDKTYKLVDRNNKSILAHIASLAANDSHSATNEQLFGYDYYLDPNFTSTATSQKPTAFFNYFKRGTRPNAVPTTYGLEIEQPSAGNFTPTGRLHTMLDFDFERPKSEIFTAAKATFLYTNKESDGTPTTERRTLTFEAIQIKDESDMDDFRWSGKEIATSPNVAYGTHNDNASEWLRVKLDGSGDYDASSGTATPIARIQYINKVEADTIDNSNPAYVIVSDIDESINSTAFADGVIWYGVDAAGDATTSSITLKSRPSQKYGIKRTATIESEATGDDLREQLASILIKSSNQIVRGNFQTFEKPRFYIDNSPTSVSALSEGAQTITLSGSVNPLNYGFREGMVVMELDSDGEPTATYGYASSVSSTQVVVTWSTGSIGDSDTVRYYVPVRAGDVINVRNDLVNVDGIYLVTEITYTEQPGVSTSRYEVVGQEDLTVGGRVRKTLAVTTTEALGRKMNLPIKQTSTANALLTSTTFSATTNGTVVDADGVYWTAGSLSVGIGQYTINSGTTITTMVASGDGNTGQSGTALAADTDYYIYYPGSGTALKTIRKAAYLNVSSEDTVLIAQCKAGTTKAEFTLFASTFKNNPVDGAREHSLSNILTKKGAQPWSTDIKFEGTDWNDIRWYKAQNSDGTAVSGTSTAGTISFGDDTTEAININAGTTLATGTGGRTHYIYKTVGTSASATLVVTANYADAYRDDRVLLALVTVAATDDGTDSPTIMPFNGNVQTLSATAIAANSITAGNIAANTITASEIAADAITASEIAADAITASEIAADAVTASEISATALDTHTITLATGGKFVTASGLSRTGTENWTSMAGGGTGGGIVIDSLGIIGTSKSDDGDINDTEFYISATDGKAYFGGGLVTASTAGLVIGESTGGGAGFLKWEAPSKTDAFIYRVQSDNGYDAGTIIFNANGDMVLTGGDILIDEVTTEEIHFQSGNSHIEFSTWQAPWNYEAGSSSTARYTVVLPTAVGAANEVFAIASLSSTTMTMDWAADATSSLRYKENIASLNIDTSKIFNLVPKSFTWKKDMGSKILDPKGTDRPSFGYIAEEVEEFLPEILGYDEENKPKRLDYKLLGVLLIEEVKKLKRRIEILEGG